MACLQPPCLSSINLKLSTPKPTFSPRTHFLKTFTVSSTADSSPCPPQNLSTIGQNPVGTAAIEDGEEDTKKIPEAIRIAMEKAMEYKRNKGLVDTEVGPNNPVEPINGHGSGETKEAVRFILEGPKEYKGFVGEGQLITEVGAEPTNEDDGEEAKKIPDRVKSALEKAREYKMNKGLVRDVKSEVKTEVDRSPIEPANEDDGEETMIPDRVKSALEKAREYKLNKGLVCAVKNEVKTEVGQGQDEPANSDGERRTRRIPDEIRIGMERAREYRKKKGLVSASDNTKKGGNEVIEDDDLPEVEIIVGDATKFGNNHVSVEQTKEDRTDQRYKPKISKWIQ